MNWPGCYSIALTC